MAQDTLDVVAGKINALTEKLGKAGEDMRKYRATRNELIVEAHRRIVIDKEIATTFEQWCADTQLAIGYRMAKKIVLQLTGPRGNVQSEAGEQVPTENTVEQAAPADNRTVAERREDLERDKRKTPEEKAAELRAGKRRVIEAAMYDAGTDLNSIMAELGWVRAEELQAQHTNDKRLLAEATRQIVELEAKLKVQPAKVRDLDLDAELRKPVNIVVQPEHPMVPKFFEYAGSNMLWMEQRLAESAPRDFKIRDVRTQWFQRFDELPEEQQALIRQQIKAKHAAEEF